MRGRLPAGLAVWAANHHSWWDPFIALDLCRQAQRRAVVVMNGDNLRRYQFARRIGAIGTDELRAGLDTLRAGAVLVLYPETELRAAGPPGSLAPGAAWFAQQAPARLSSAAVRVALRGEQFPEAYVVLTDVEGSGTRAAVTRRLHDQLGPRPRGYSTGSTRAATRGSRCPVSALWSAAVAAGISVFLFFVLRC